MPLTVSPSLLRLDDPLREKITALLDDEPVLLSRVGEWRRTRDDVPRGMRRLLSRLRALLSRAFAVPEWNRVTADTLVAELSALFEQPGVLTVADTLSPDFTFLVFRLRDALYDILSEQELAHPTAECRLELFSELVMVAALQAWGKALARERDAAQRRLARLERLEAAGRAVIASLDVEKALQTVVSLAYEEPAWDAVLLVGPTGDEGCQLLAAAGFDAVPAADEWHVLLAAGDTPLAGPTVHASSSGTGAWLVVPFSGEYVAGGGILIYSRSEERFDRAELSYAWAFADHAAEALTNAALYEQLKRDIAARDHFFSMVNHDLKSPLANIKAQTDLILRRVHNGKLALETDEGRGDLVRRLEQISQRSRELGRQIDDLVDVSRIESQRLAVHRSREDLIEVVRSAVESLQTLYAGRQIRLDVPDNPLWASVDAVRITQVVNNLVSNAVKYSTEESGIVVRLLESDSQACLQVVDQGRGIPSEFQPHLFESYTRQGRRAPGRGDGLGLGLYIVAGIVRAHDGTITIESEPGRGSTFTVCLPLAVPYGQTSSRASSR